MIIKPTLEQRAIIEHTGGHARVLAVAGSGKTFTMGQRIAYLVKEKNVNPKRIRALMFNRLARDQFVQRMMRQGFTKMNLPYISTFHSFAYQFIQHLIDEERYPKKYFWIGEYEERARILLHKVIRILRKEGTLLPENVPGGSFDIEEVQKIISLYKGALIPPDRAGYRFNEFIPIIYKRYEIERSRANALTYDDFIPVVVRALEKDDLLREKWTAKLDHLIVDEYQDVNYGQQRLIEILAGDKAEVMVVGDDDQTIYEWRGARPNYILRDFLTVFSNRPHTTYRLSYSFRFGPIIAQAAQNSIIHNTIREEKKLIAYQEKRRSNIFVKHGTPHSMSSIYREMAQEIIRLVKKDGVRPSQIWILGRMYSQLMGLEVMLLSLNIPYRVLGGRPFYERSELVKLTSYLAISANLDKVIDGLTVDKFLSILNFPNRKISSQKIAAILTSAMGNQRTWIGLLKWMLEDAGQIELGFNEEQYEALKDLIRLLIITHEELDKPIVHLLKRVVELSNLQDHLNLYYGEGEASMERKEMIDGFLKFVRERNLTTQEYFSYLKKIDPTKGAPVEELITLSTIHRTKGLEFEYVFIPACFEGFMPYLDSSPVAIFDKKMPKVTNLASENIENERRLFYVALTRAINAVYIATLKPDIEKSPTLPSRFLDEILLDECNSTLDGIVQIKEWPESKVEEWLQKVKAVAGRKGFIENIEKYLHKLKVAELRQQVADIGARATTIPFKYNHPYNNTQPDHLGINEGRPPELNFWDEVIDI